ncbi:MAG TPA: AAA family ATPase [Actinomycetota bacterium]
MRRPSEIADLITDEDLIGRERETQRLSDLLDRAFSEGPHAGVLLGPAGIGKTALLRWAQRVAGERGALTGSVRAPAAAGLPARFPIGELLNGVVDEARTRGVEPPMTLTKVLDTIRGITTNDEYPAALPQIAQGLEDIASLAPVALMIDDYHWAPKEGVDLLLQAVRVVEGPIAIIATSRLAEDGQQAIRLPEPTSDLWVDYIEVRGLTPEQVQDLAHRELGGELLPSIAEHLHDRTLGNPMFVIETLRSWKDADALSAIGGHWTVDLGKVKPSRSLTEMIAAKMRTLPPEATDIARALAALGREATFEELRAYSGMTIDSLVGVLDLLQTRHLLQASSPAQYKLLHPLHETSVISTTPSASLAELHSRIFNALRSLSPNASPRELAFHAGRSLVPPDELADLLHQAAQAAELSGASHEASDLYGELLAHVLDPLERRDLLEARARTLTHSHPLDAVELLNEAVDLAPTSSSPSRLLLMRSYASRLAGRFEDARRDLDGASAEADDKIRADIAHNKAVMAGVEHDTDTAERLLVDLASQDLEEPLRIRVLGHLAQARYARGEISSSRTMIDEALAMGPEPRDRAYLEANLGWLMVLEGSWDEASTTLRRSITRSERSGDFWNLCLNLNNYARLSAWRGDIPAALDSALRAAAMAPKLSNIGCRIDSLFAKGATLLEAQHHEAAFEALSEAVAALESQATEPIEQPAIACTLGEVALSLGYRSEARRSLGLAERWLPIAPHWSPAVERLRLKIDPSRAGPTPGVLDAGEIGPMPFERARLALDFAQLLPASAPTATAAGLYASAALIFERLGATRYLDLCLQALAATRRGRPKNRDSRGLTPREADVVEAVAEGLTNANIARRLGIRESTVKKHVENIMTTTGIHTRTGLAKLAHASTALSGGNPKRSPTD